MRSTHPLIKSISNLILFLFLESVCLLLIFNNGITQKYILLEKSREIQKNFWERTQKIKNYSKLKEVNENLSLENLDLYKEKEFYKNELSKIKGEEYLNSFKDSASNITSYDFLWAKVIKNTLNSAHNYLIIDRGSDDGIVEDMGVITKNGVVGVIRSVGKSHSYVYSFLNSNQQVSSKINNTGAFGPLLWNKLSLNSAILSEIPQHTVVNKGDTVYTSGHSSFFPKDIPLGVVEDSKIVRGTHLDVNVRLFQDFNNLTYVIIVKKNNLAEIDKLSKAI